MKVKEFSHSDYDLADAEMFGLEIEVEGARIAADVPYMERKRDGSLRGHGIEYVSMRPVTYDELRVSIDSYYKVAEQYGFTPTVRCGIHVHVSKTWFSNKKALAIKKFLQRQTDLSLFELWFGRKPNTYCDPQQLSGRYGAVNTTNDHTNEVRMFRSGTLEWAKYCVAMSKYMVENAYTLTEHGMSAVRAMHCQEEQYDF